MDVLLAALTSLLRQVFSSSAHSLDRNRRRLLAVPVALAASRRLCRLPARGDANFAAGL